LITCDIDYTPLAVVSTSDLAVTHASSTAGGESVASCKVDGQVFNFTETQLLSGTFFSQKEDGVPLACFGDLVLVGNSSDAESYDVVAFDILTTTVVWTWTPNPWDPIADLNALAVDGTSVFAAYRSGVRRISAKGNFDNFGFDFSLSSIVLVGTGAEEMLLGTDGSSIYGMNFAGAGGSLVWQTVPNYTATSSLIVPGINEDMWVPTVLGDSVYLYRLGVAE